jgi:hypothetical protein
MATNFAFVVFIAWSLLVDLAFGFIDFFDSVAFYFIGFLIYGKIDENFESLFSQYLLALLKIVY